MTASGVSRQNANLYPDYTTSSSACVVEDTRSLHSSSDGFSDRLLATNILSRMAKTKASWVENQRPLENWPHLQRRSPILCKGKPFGHASLTPFMENKLFSDRRTKGVRDGKKFDLLPISKYLTQCREEEKSHRDQCLPLVLISSYDAMCGGEGEKELRKQKNEHREKITFFTTKDIFKPLHARSEPTRGETLYIPPSQRKLNTKYHVKLPRMNKSLNNAFDTGIKKPSKTSHSRFYYKENVAFPVIAK